jgi:hypothetical protein
MIERYTVLIVALATLAPTEARPQATPVGQVERIAELIGGGEPVKIDRRSDRVQILRAEAEWMLIGPDAGVQTDDRLRVRRYVDVRFRVERPRERGRLVLLPEILTSNGATVFAVDSVGTHADYVVSEDASSRGDLTIEVEGGSLIVDWSAGRLAVIAAGVRTLVTGTRVAWAVDATGDSGFLFLEEGRLTFPDFPELDVRPGQVVTLRRDLPPAVSTPEPTAAARLGEAVRYNGQRIWDGFRPFWQRPAFFVPGALVVGGTVGAIVALTGDDPPPLVGTVIVSIPF